jgi:hypothetical protein
VWLSSCSIVIACHSGRSPAKWREIGSVIESLRRSASLRMSAAVNVLLTEPS